MKNPSYVYKAKIINVVDGDTVDAIIDLGFGVSFNTRLRLAGIDTMETNDKDAAKKALGLKAKERVKELLTNKDVTLQSFKEDKYGRYLAEIYVNDIQVNQSLINEGLAVPYFGGTK